MGAALPIGMGIASLLSGVLQNRGRRATQTTRPTFDPAFSPLKRQLMQHMTSRIGQKTQLAQGIGNQQIANTNNVFANLRRAQTDRLAANGQLGGNVETAGRNALDIARGSEITGVLNNLPLIEDNMDQENLRSGSSLLALGRGSTTESSTPPDLAGGIGTGLDDFGSFLGTMFANKGKDPNGMSPAWAQWLRMAMQNRGTQAPVLGSMPGGTGDSFFYGS